MSLLDPAVLALHRILDALAAVLPGGLVAAIMLLTFAVRASLFPLALKAFRGQRALLALAPDVQQLRRRHRDDPQRLARELNALHRKAGVSPFAGMAPMLLTAPLVMALYRMVSLLGDPFGTHWAPLLTTGGPLTWLLFSILMTGLLVVAIISTRQHTEGPKVLRLLPFGTVVAGLMLPVGVGVYLLSTTSWTVLERAVLPHLA